MITNKHANPENPYETGPSKLPILYNLIHGLAMPFILLIFQIIVLVSFFIKRKQIYKQRPASQQPKPVGASDSKLAE